MLTNTMADHYIFTKTEITNEECAVRSFRQLTAVGVLPRTKLDRETNFLGRSPEY